MGEIEIEYCGVGYVAVPGQGCDGCAFDCAVQPCREAACCAHDRSDGVDVIFIEAQANETTN